MGGEEVDDEADAVLGEVLDGIAVSNASRMSAVPLGSLSAAASSASPARAAAASARSADDAELEARLQRLLAS